MKYREQKNKLTKINKFNKSLPRLRTKNQNTIKIRNESKAITTNHTENKRTIREHYEQLYTNKLDNVNETDQN